MENKSLWQDGIKPLNITNKIPDNLNVDILIIGGGMAGISTLYELEHNANIVLIDKNKIGFGVTSRTTGKLNFMQELCYHKLENIFSFDIARLYYESQIEAIKLVKHYSLLNNIDCNYTSTDSFVFTNNEDEISNFKKEENFYRRINVKIDVDNEIPCNIPSIRSLKASNSAVFHPLKYLYGLANISLKDGKKIYEGVRALTIDKIDSGYIVTTNCGKITTKKLIVTTHYPFFINPGFIPFKTHIENSYVIASKTDKDYPSQIISSNKPTDSIRYHSELLNNYFIYAGMSSKPSNHMNSEALMSEIIEKGLTKFNITSDYMWHTHDIMTNDSLPFIGRINKANPNLFIATGFNKWGMTNSVIAGKVIKDLITNNNSKYERLFSPTRLINIEKVKNFFIDSLNISKALLKAKLIKNQSFYHDNIIIEYENGHRIGIYIDEYGQKHKVYNVCPHMKCNLIFNNLDKTWDCPCHGSRFDIDGNVTEGPSVYSIKIAKKRND